MFPVIILTFTSSTLVPVATMPGWLQAFANINPITVMVGALRALCLGGPTARPVSEALAWIGGLLLITVPLAVTRYSHCAARPGPHDFRGPCPRSDRRQGQPQIGEDRHHGTRRQDGPAGHRR